jgi:hypothetical protein
MENTMPSERPIIVIADSALFDLGVTLGFGAVLGALLAVTLFQAASFLMNKTAALFRKPT